ncbi:formyltransferase family protein [Candidatus Thioglobus sp.]|nr:formyltransferase family protein [Candidatus Thioglobus sp.]
MKNNILRILFLGDDTSPILNWLNDNEEFVLQTNDKINANLIHSNNINFLVSYNYRYILSMDVLDLLPFRAINLHISYLPYNRGTDPNFWSFVDGTPSGVSIHYIDEGVDTGDIIVQEKVSFNSEKDTLKDSYSKLQLTIQELFKQSWHDIKAFRCNRQKQVGIGTSHKKSDRKILLHLLQDEWNTKISVIDAYNSLRKLFKLRPVNLSDSDILLSWRNDVVTRKNSFNSELNSLKIHKQYLKNAISSLTRKIFILEYSGFRVGTIREDKIKEGEFKLSYTVDPMYRGKRVGQMMLSLYLKDRKGVFICVVKDSNTPSIKMIEKMNFKLFNSEEGINLYKLYQN